MKKTMKTLLALMAGTMALAACSDNAVVENNNTQQPEQFEGGRKLITLTAVQEEIGRTRAAISSENDKQIVWAADDDITVLYRDANTKFGFDNVDFTLADGAGTASGTFEGTVLETVTDQTLYTALYPLYAQDEDARQMTLDDLTEDEQFWYENCLIDDEFDQELLDWCLEQESISQEQYDHIMAFVNGELIFTNRSITLTADGKVTDVVFPATQTATEGSFDPAAGLMMAQTTGNAAALAFKNVASYFKFVAPLDCSKVKIFDNAHADQMAGTVTLDYNNGEPTATVTANGASCITLTGTIEAGKTYYIATLPQAFTEGVTMCFVMSDGTEYVKHTNGSCQLGRNKMTDLDAAEPSALNPPYVTFSAAEEQTLTMTEQEVEGLEYSVGGGAWTTLGSNTVEFGGQGNDLRLRGTNGWGTARNDNEYAVISFGNETPVACSGDIRTLVDYINHENVSTANARFCFLFYQCNQLTSAPLLPATTLADHCYYDMFRGCLGLETAPELPATTLAENCYEGMFNDCASLTDAPALPATTLVEGCYESMLSSCENLVNAPVLPATALATRCYRYMFFNCSSLINAPALPATTLAEGCYESMFNYCYELVNAPELPATTLAKDCYNYMFFNCSKLAGAPELPATTLVEGCYNSMFKNCSSLNYVKAAFTTTPGPDYTDGWLKGVAASGTFVKNPDATWNVTGANGVPEGWTVRTY